MITAINIKKRLANQKSLFLFGLAFALIVVILLSAAIGAYGLSAGQIIGLVLSGVGIDTGVSITQQDAAVFWNIRLPRVLLGVFVGGGLGVAGAAMQGLFRNPLVSPGLIGITSGSALITVAFLVVGAPLLTVMTPYLGMFSLSFVAFSGALLSTFVAYKIATSKGQTMVVTLILAGVAVAALSQAGIGLFSYLATESQLRSVTFWQLGSLGGASWTMLWVAIPLISLSVYGIYRHAAALDALALGEDEARYLGFRVQYIKVTLIVLTAIIVGTSVAAAGIIAFIGLIVPHLVRLSIGPDHKTLLPGAALMGATLLILADTISRWIVAPAEIPLSVITAIIGGPFFVWLILNYKKRFAPAG